VAIRNANHAERIGRPQRHLGDQPAFQPFAPEGLGGAVGRVDPAIETRPHQSGDRRQPMEGGNVAAPVADLGVQLAGGQPRMGLDPIEHAWQEGLFQAPIAQPSDRGYRNRD